MPAYAALWRRECSWRCSWVRGWYGQYVSRSAERPSTFCAEGLRSR